MDIKHTGMLCKLYFLNLMSEITIKYFFVGVIIEKRSLRTFKEMKKCKTILTKVQNKVQGENASPSGLSASAIWRKFLACWIGVWS